MVIEYKIREFTKYPFRNPLPPRFVFEYFSLIDEIKRLKLRVAELEGKEVEGEEIMIEDMTRDEAKQEIIRLFKSGKTLFYSDIVKELGIELQMAVDICNELQKDNRIEIDASV